MHNKLSYIIYLNNQIALCSYHLQTGIPDEFTASSPKKLLVPLPLPPLSPVMSEAGPLNCNSPSSSSFSNGNTDLDESSFNMEDCQTSSGDSSTATFQQQPELHNERKFVIFESQIDKLFQMCQICGSPVSDVEKSTHGGNLRVTTTCLNHCSFTWTGQPLLHAMSAGNLLMAAAILFSGMTYAKFAQFATLLNLQCLAERTFYEIQKDILWPVIQDAWNKKQSELFDELQGQQVKLSGDGRCDSPGHTAKYGTYTVMDSETDKVVDFQIVQKSEVKNSSVMEKEGLVRCLDKLKEANVKVIQLATDRHPQICAYMNRQDEICHQFDLWHVAKGLSKKLGQKASVHGAEELSNWIRSIINHLWWCCAACDGNVDMLRDMWKSSLLHTIDVHEWGFSELFPMCEHEPLSEEERQDIIWLEEDTAAYEELAKVVREAKLNKDLAKMTQFAHTGALEVYHSMLTKYCPKRQHFSYEGMVARTTLAVMDHNHNTGRSQAITQDGEERFKYEWSKISKCWVAKPIAVGKDYSYLQDLMARVVEVRQNKEQLAPIPRPAKTQGNIAPEARPDKQVLLERHQSRFT